MRQGIGRTGAAAWLALLAWGCDGPVAPLADGGMRDGGAGVCGDAVVQAGEGCDDGDLEAGDGCDARCRREVGTGHASAVVDAPGATGMGFGDPERAINGVRGGGRDQQSL